MFHSITSNKEHSAPQKSASYMTNNVTLGQNEPNAFIMKSHMIDSNNLNNQ